MLPTIAEISHLEFLGFALELYVIKIPIFIIWIADTLLVAILVMLSVKRVSIDRKEKKGGCG